MNKSVKRFTCLLMSVLTLSSMVACEKGGKKKQAYDPEERPFVLATEALDGNFNPFFATSATDTEMISMTQIGMLSVDKDGNPVCGENEATVALDYKVTYLADDAGTVTTDASKALYTDYEFVIKNGIKFSDGEPLTIKDVLFNLYVYLDPVYMGSATIYSTDIVGLKAYRAQDPDMEGATEGDIQASFYTKAEARYTALVAWLADTKGEVAETEQIKKDYATAQKLFKEEVESDWTNNVGQLESYEEKYRFTEDWQVFLFNEGLVSIETNADGAVKDENGRYVTDFKDYPEVIAGATTAEKIAAYKALPGNAEVSDADARNALIKEECIDLVYGEYTSLKTKFVQVMYYWMTGTNAIEDFANDEKSKHYADIKADGKLDVPEISGISTYQTSSFDGVDLGEKHDVLKIKINKVDPKAIWNFSFGVAPMHYYSNEETIKSTDFGVKMGDKDFFDNVLKATNKNGLPVGAGVYKASSANEKDVNFGSFYNNNWVYFVRNDYFETVGEGLHNAKIRKLRYKVVSSDRIIQQLESGDIDYGEPNASQANSNEVSQISHLTSISYKTNGYGYVGINPKHVEQLEVRQAIMMAMDTQSIIRNYYPGLADTIWRPMSTTSWAYPTGATEYSKIAYQVDNQPIIDKVLEVEGASQGSDGKLYINGKPLKYKFTIAGETTDHPAFEMFQDAAKRLNECGFDITVGTDVSALRKLASGELAVWAAAWSSTVDPDMYQVYHKDSNATSVKNWGYDVILKDLTGKYERELEIINELSDLIDQGRETLEQSKRKEIYSQALDKVMDLAVELPTYQRNDLVAFNKNVIDLTTVNQNASANEGVIDRIWEVNYN